MNAPHAVIVHRAYPDVDAERYLSAVGDAHRDAFERWRDGRYEFLCLIVVCRAIETQCAADLLLRR